MQNTDQAMQNIELNPSAAFSWDEALKNEVAELADELASESMGARSSLSNTFNLLHTKVNRTLLEWLKKYPDINASKPEWLEILLWSENLSDYLRPAEFSRVPFEEEQPFDKWLYNEFFPEFYKTALKNVSAFSELHYTHNLTDCLFFQLSHDEVKLKNFRGYKPREVTKLQLTKDWWTKAAELRGKLEAMYYRSSNDQGNQAPSRKELANQLEELLTEFRQGTDGGSDNGLLARLSWLGNALSIEEEKLAGDLRVGMALLSFVYGLKGRDSDPSQNSLACVYFFPSRPWKRRSGTENEPFVASSIVLTTKNELAATVTGTLHFISALTQSRLAEFVLEFHFLRLARVHAARAARAAVLARNFSHIIGSHVISNPDFVERLLPAVWTFKDAVSALVDVRDGGTADEWQEWGEGFEELKKEANERNAWSKYSAVKAFHTYLQGRFDFIARAVEQQQADRPEPVFWVADVLEGFFKQSAFLDTLTADIGLCLDKMHVVLHLPEGKNGEHDANGEMAHFVGQWGKQEDGEKTSCLQQLHWRPCDEHGNKAADAEKSGGRALGQPSELALLVGLPGGMIATHALYALLENVIRNSAKYGTDRTTISPGREMQTENQEEGGLRKYYLHLKLKEKTGKDSGKESSETIEERAAEIRQGSAKVDHYELRVWDNYSGVGENHKAHQNVQSALDTPLIDTTGELNREALGFQEMKICADNLWAELNEGQSVDATKVDRLKLAAVDDSAADENGQKRLTFCLDLAKPVLLACVGGKPDCGSPYIKKYEWCDVEKLSASGAHMVMVNGNANGESENAIQTLKQWHTGLPYRLLFVCKDEERENHLRDSVNKHSNISNRRVQFITDTDGQLWDRLFGAGEGESEKSEDDDLTLPERLIIDCYEAWLRAWKPIAFDADKDGGWHLWIGFERTRDQLEATWGTYLEKFKSKLIQIGVRAYQEHSTRSEPFFSKKPSSDKDRSKRPNEFLKGKVDDEGYWQKDAKRNHCDKRILLFDNHGKCFPKSEAVREKGEVDPKRWCRFYQEFGSETIDLYQQLHHPPSSPFGFACFILSLVESCLTEVVVVDERLVSDVMTDATGRQTASPETFGRALRSHQRAGVWPVFTFKQVDDEETMKGFFSAGQKEQFFSAVLGKPLKDLAPEIQDEAKTFFKEEGVFFGEDNDTGKNPRLGLLTTETEFSGDSNFNGFKVLNASCPLGKSVKCTDEREDGETKEIRIGCQNIAPDVIVVHEGTLDMIHDDEAVEWGGTSGEEEEERKKTRLEHIQRLWQLGPVVVRTSGRGRTTRHLREELPFIEFGEVSSAILTSRNKYAFVRGLLGTSGMELPQSESKTG